MSQNTILAAIAAAISSGGGVDELPYVAGRRYRLCGAPMPEDEVQTATADRLYVLPPRIIKHDATFTKIEIEESASGGAGASGNGRVGLMNWSTLALIQDIAALTFSGSGAVRSATGLSIPVTEGQIVSPIIACSAAIKAIGERYNNNDSIGAANTAYFTQTGLPSWATTLAWYNSATLFKPGMMTHTYGALPNPIAPTASGAFCPIIAFSY